MSKNNKRSFSYWQNRKWKFILGNAIFWTFATNLLIPFISMITKMEFSLATLAEGFSDIYIKLIIFFPMGIIFSWQMWRNHNHAYKQTLQEYRA